MGPKTVEEILAILESVMDIAPDLLAIFQTIKNDGSISLEQLQTLQAERRAAIEKAIADLAAPPAPSVSDA